jgi:hypothetical protein
MIICLLFAGYVGSLGDKSKRSVVEIKGRFSVTSENVDLAKVQEVPTSGISRKLQEVRICALSILLKALLYSTVYTTSKPTSSHQVS